MMEATRVLLLLQEVKGDTEDLLNYTQYDNNDALSALYHLNRTIEHVRKLSYKERGIIL